MSSSTRAGRYDGHVGRRLALNGWRVTVCGDLTVTDGRHTLIDTSLPGPQARLALAMLVVEHRRVLLRDELAEDLWPDGPPDAWEVAVRSLISKLRRRFDQAGLDGAVIASAPGGYRLEHPGPIVVDTESAASRIHAAEALTRRGSTRDAAADALVASMISARPFLAGFDGPWAAARRAELRDIRIRSLHVLADSWIDLGDPAQAVRDSERALALDPYREGLYRVLMRAHVALGDRAGAARAYDRCRRLLADELGVAPSQRTREAAAALDDAL